MLQSISRLYSRLSNRTIAIGVLAVVLPIGGYVLHYFLAINTGTVEIRSPLADSFTIQVQAGAITLINRSCIRSCALKDIPAGTYTYTVSALGKKEISGALSVSRGSSSVVDLAWEYSVTLSPEKITPVVSPNRDFKYQDWITPNIVGYSTGSLSLGYFITVDASGLYTLINTGSRESTPLRLPTEAASITRVKAIRNTPVLVIQSKKEAYLYDIRRWDLTLLPYYTDIDQDQYGRMIGLVSAKNSAARELLSLSDPGDLLLDITTPGAIRVLQSGLSDIDYVVSSGDIFELHLADGTTKSLTWQK